MSKDLLVSIAQMDMMTHALGKSHPESKLGWRNQYMAEDGAAECEALVTLGLMARGCTINDGRDRYYHVSNDGIAFLRRRGFDIELRKIRPRSQQPKGAE